MSTSGAMFCENGLVDDSLFLYTSLPCIVPLNVHYGLSIFWVILFVLLLLEVLISRLLGYFSKFRPAKVQEGRGGVLAKDFAYVFFVFGALIRFMVVVCYPRASVQDHTIGGVLWFGTALSLSGVVVLAALVTVVNTKPLLVSIGFNSSNHQHKNINTAIFQIIKYFQYALCSTCITAALVTFIILPNVLINFSDRQTSIEVGFILFGVAFGLVMLSVSVTNEAIIKIVDSRIQFERDLSARSQTMSNSLLRLKKKLRVISVSAPACGIVCLISFVLIGVNVISLIWITVHVLFGAVPTVFGVIYRATTRDSIFEACCCVNRSSNKDHEASTDGSIDKVGVMEMSEQFTPSEYLATIDSAALKGPALLAEEDIKDVI